MAERTLFSAEPYLSVTRQTVRTETGHEIDDYYQVLLPHFVIGYPLDEQGRQLKAKFGCIQRRQDRRLLLDGIPHIHFNGFEIPIKWGRDHLLFNRLQHKR